MGFAQRDGTFHLVSKYILLISDATVRIVKQTLGANPFDRVARSLPQSLSHSAFDSPLKFPRAQSQAVMHFSNFKSQCKTLRSIKRVMCSSFQTSCWEIHCRDEGYNAWIESHLSLATSSLYPDITTFMVCSSSTGNIADTNPGVVLYKGLL